MRARKTAVYRIDIGPETASLVGLTERELSALGPIDKRFIGISGRNPLPVTIYRAEAVLGGPMSRVVVVELASDAGEAGTLLMVYPWPLALGLIDMTCDLLAGTTEQIDKLGWAVLAGVSRVVETFGLDWADQNHPPVSIMAARSLREISVRRLLASLHGAGAMADQLIEAGMVFTTHSRSISGTLLVVRKTRVAGVVGTGSVSAGV